MRILVFQTAYLGDVVLTTPLLKTLKKRIPSAYVACAVQPAWAPVLENSGMLDKIITFDKRGVDTGAIGTLRLAMSLRKERFDVALCPHPSFRSGLILRLAGIPRRVGFETSSGRMFFTETLPKNEKEHEVRRVLSLAKALGISDDDFVDQPSVSPDPNLDADAILERLGIEPGRFGLVGVHPGSVWATKRWLPEGFSSVCKAIARRGFTVLVFGNDEERPLVTQVVEGADTERVVPCTGLTLPELIAVINRLALYITNDSGPMHVACALGIPVIAIFGSTVPDQGYAPYCEHAAVVETKRLDCRPCGPHGHDSCPLDNFLCMKNVHPESVLLAARVLSGGFADSGFIKVLLNDDYADG